MHVIPLGNDVAGGRFRSWILCINHILINMVAAAAFPSVCGRSIGQSGKKHLAGWCAHQSDHGDMQLRMAGADVPAMDALRGLRSIGIAHGQSHRDRPEPVIGRARRQPPRAQVAAVMVGSFGPPCGCINVAGIRSRWRQVWCCNKHRTWCCGRYDALPQPSTLSFARRYASRSPVCVMATFAAGSSLVSGRSTLLKSP